MIAIHKETKQKWNDQLIFVAVNKTHPEEINVFPDGWDMTAPIGYRPYDKMFPDVSENVLEFLRCRFCDLCTTCFSIRVATV